MRKVNRAVSSSEELISHGDQEYPQSIQRKGDFVAEPALSESLAASPCLLQFYSALALSWVLR